ncbi:MAG TPA: pilin [Candidatus Moranbacteria bacterium]|nr:pilin [Candidatus Moranbacteria bacterium]
MKNKIKSVAYSIISGSLLLMPALAGAQYYPPVGTNLPSSTIMRIITNIMNWLLAAVGIVGVIGFCIAGILYLTAAGDETRIGTAKNAMMYSIIGVIVALAGLVALSFAKNMLNSNAGF